MTMIHTMLLSATLALTSVCAVAQKKGARVDPHTKNDPALMEKAGYTSFGPFDFGQQGGKRVTTEELEKALYPEEMLWVETEHFRFGCSLDAWDIPTEQKTRRKLRAELTRLSKKLPKINPRTRRLTRWLRLHLFAQRLEDLYAETSELFGVVPADFPQDQGSVVSGGDATEYMGFGPYLGMREKFHVLLFERQATHSVYLKRYIGRGGGTYGQRWHFVDMGALIFVTSAECEERRLNHDTALHCSVAFNVSMNLLDGFRYYSYDLPVWIRESFAHWFERRVDPEWNSFDQNEGAAISPDSTWRWKLHTRKLIAKNEFTPFSEAYAWRDFGDIKFDDHVTLWSRFDFLMAQGDKKWRKFLMAIKGRVDAKTWKANSEDLVGAVRKALQDAYGLSPLILDEKWKAWVAKTYPTR